MNRPLRPIGALLTVLVCSATSHAIGTQPKDLLDWDLDPSQVAVRSVESPTQNARELPIAGWWLVPNRGPQTDAAAIETVFALIEDGASFATPVLVGENGGPVLPTPELLVGLNDQLHGEVGRLWLAERTSGLVESRYPAANIYRIRLELRSGTEVLDLCDELARDRRVTFAEPDVITSGGGSALLGNNIPNDPEFANMWGLENTGQFSGVPGTDLGALEAWTLTTGSPEVPVVVIDVGVDPNHPDLNLATGADFTSEGFGTGAPRSDCDLHGTLVAGTICAKMNNGVGVVGIAPDSPVISARCFIADTSGVCNGTWFARTSWTADALQWANAQGHRLTNNSNFYNFPSQAVEAMYLSTQASGLVHFASAGNAGAQGLTWPARADGVIGVGGYTYADERGSFSNFGPTLDLMGPGQLIRTTDLPGTPGLDPGDYKWTVGTSLSSPYIAGVAALLLTREPGLTSAEVEARLIASAIDMDAPGRDDLTGWGRVFAPSVLVPCEAPSTICVATPNSTGNAAHLSSNGSASLSAGGLSFVVNDAPPNEVGIFFYGPDIVQTPFENGVLCAGGGSIGVFRVDHRVPISPAGQAQATFDFDKAPLASGAGEWTLGSSWTVQFYFRDLAAGGTGANLSDALRLTVCP